jgi:hypothetical protein
MGKYTLHGAVSWEQFTTRQWVSAGRFFGLAMRKEMHQGAGLSKKIGH